MVDGVQPTAPRTTTAPEGARNDVPTARADFAALLRGRLDSAEGADAQTRTEGERGGGGRPASSGSVTLGALLGLRGQAPPAPLGSPPAPPAGEAGDTAAAPAREPANESSVGQARGGRDSGATPQSGVGASAQPFGAASDRVQGEAPVGTVQPHEEARAEDDAAAQRVAAAREALAAQPDDGPWDPANGDIPVRYDEQGRVGYYDHLAGTFGEGIRRAFGANPALIQMAMSNPASRDWIDDDGDPVVDIVGTARTLLEDWARQQSWADEVPERMLADYAFNRGGLEALAEQYGGYVEPTEEHQVRRDGLLGATAEASLGGEMRAASHETAPARGREDYELRWEPPLAGLREPADPRDVE